MRKPLPIVCTLPAAELVDRGAAWRDLLGRALVERTRIPGGIRLTVEPDAYATLAALIELERDCCAWIDFDMDGHSTVSMTAGGPGEAVLAGMFTAADH